MKSVFRLLAWSLLVFGVWVPSMALAASPGLQLNPLKYEDTLVGDHIRTGYIDVANPTDRTVSIETDVKGFKQVNLDGDLEFFLDDPIKQAIKLGLTSFDLGPRESVRVSFTVDPTKLPRGGVYAAAFFRTVPPQQTSGISFVAESANVGTLLLLQNGDESEHIGRVSQFDLPFWQLGSGLSGRGEYQNTNRTTAPIAFSPKLEVRMLPWGRPVSLTGPYVLPGATREAAIERKGSYFGLWPVLLADAKTGEGITKWVFVCTGIYAFVALFLLSLMAVYVLSRMLRRLPLMPPSWRKLFRRKQPAAAKRSLDGLGPKPKA